MTFTNLRANCMAAVRRRAMIAGLVLGSMAAACTAPRDSASHAPPDRDAQFQIGDADTAPSDTGSAATEAFDSAPIAETAAETALDTTPAADTPTCVEGSACDDRDSCTVNDQCAEGQCRGTALDCDDHVPCTIDSCGAGMCKHAPQAGYCLIDGACWTAEQHNPTNSCQRCRPGADAADWTDTDGLKCNDGDPCTEGEACLAGACQGGAAPLETCDNGADDDCDGDTDAKDSECGAPGGCTYHTDCYPEGVCALHRFTGETKCSVPCAGDAQCGANEICAKLPGSLQVGYCEEADPALRANGTACSDDSECRSRICSDYVCVSLCMDEAECPAVGETCHPVGDLSAGIVMTACAPDAAGSIPNGQLCQIGANFDTVFCASGHCDLMPYPASEVLPCAPMCKGESGCAPWQECNIVVYSPGAHPDAVPYDAQFTQATHDAVSGCFTPPQPGGTLGLGAPCTTPSQCSSYKCLALTPGDPQKYCTSYCEFDQECASGMQCKLEAVTLVSAWLQNSLVAPQPAAPGAWTLARICKFQ